MQCVLISCLPAAKLIVHAQCSSVTVLDSPPEHPQRRFLGTRVASVQLSLESHGATASAVRLQACIAELEGRLQKALAEPERQRFVASPASSLGKSPLTYSSPVLFLPAPTDTPRTGEPASGVASPSWLSPRDGAPATIEELSQYFAARATGAVARNRSPETLQIAASPCFQGAHFHQSLPGRC